MQEPWSEERRHRTEYSLDAAQISDIHDAGDAACFMPQKLPNAIHSPNEQPRGHIARNDQTKAGRL